MNCEQYREAIAADPSFDGGAGHLSECAACQDYRAEMQALDARISRALALDVPELELPELPDVGSTVVSLGSKRRFKAPAWFAVAATVLVAAVLGVRLLGTGIEHDTLAEEVLAHIDHEPAALVVTDKPVPDERLHQVVPDNIAHLNHSAGLITYAQTCVIRGHDVPHLVIQGVAGPVTILLMPEEELAQAEVLSGEHVNGVILPVGSGSIAIVGEHEERLEDIQKEVLKSVTWST